MSMKMFKKLSKTTVNLAVSDTEYLTCPLLSIADLEDYRTGLGMLCSEKLEEQAKGRDLLIAVVKRVLPEKFHDKLHKLYPQELGHLAFTLMFGDENDEPDEAKKKLELPAPPRSSTTSSQSAASCGNMAGESKRSWLSRILSSWFSSSDSTGPGLTPP